MAIAVLREAGLAPVSPVRVGRDASGAPTEAHPYEGYARRSELELHAWGRGPFCRLSVDGLPAEPGVYAFVEGEDVLYVGKSIDLARRFSSLGYGAIQARNCFKGGQPTNCKVNHLVLSRSRETDALQLWANVTQDYTRLEDRLITTLRPPWNGRSLGADLDPHEVRVVSAEVLVSGAQVAEGRLPQRSDRVSPRGELADQVWGRIVSHAGQVGFATLTGRPVEYRIEGGVVVVPRVTGARIPRAHFEMALEHVPLRRVTDVPKECWGPSYILAILSDPRIRDGLW